MVGMVADLTGQWQLFVSDTDGHFDGVTQAIENVMGWAVEHLGRFEIIGWPRRPIHPRADWPAISV